jgi:hypothetical protein
MGTSVPPVAAADAAEAGVLADGALADGVAAEAAALDAAPTADDVLELQPASASPMPRPSAQVPATLVVRVKCREFMTVPLVAVTGQA